MRAIVKTQAGPGFEFKTDVPEPMINEANEVKLKILKSSICGTDYHIYKWDEWSQKTIPVPHINGHECLAEVVEVGANVNKVKPGEVVVCETHNYCGHCYQCTTGNAHVCENMTILGVHVDGIWADYAVVNENILFKLSDKIEKKYAAIMEPLGNAVHTINYTNVLGQHVLVAGAGPIGIMAAEVAQKAGAASVTVLEMNEYRKNLVAHVKNVNILDPSKDDVHEEIKKITNGRMIDVVLEMTGSDKALDLCIDLLHPSGTMNVLSVYKDEMTSVKLNKLVFKNIKCQFVTGRRIFDTWHIVSDLLEKEILDKEVLDAVITHTMPMEDFEKAFEILAKGEAGKIVLEIN